MLSRPTHLPPARRRLARFLRATARTVGMPELVEEFDTDALKFGTSPELAASLTRAALGVEVAELFWVTRDMAQVAMDAAGDIPDVTLEGLPPAQQGLIIFDEGALPSGRQRGMLRGFVWSVLGTTVSIRYLAALDRDTAVRMAESVSIPAVEAPDVWQSESGITLPMDDLVALEEITTDEDYRGMVALLVATWSLMSNPTVAESRQWREARSKQAAKRRPPALVTTIALRQMRHVTDPDSESDSRSWSYQHRFVVRGHWKQQPYGPDRALRRTTWVASYIKGPEGAPLMPREHVHVWRR